MRKNGVHSGSNTIGPTPEDRCADKKVGITYSNPSTRICRPQKRGPGGGTKNPIERVFKR